MDTYTHLLETLLGNTDVSVEEIAAESIGAEQKTTAPDATEFMLTGGLGNAENNVEIEKKSTGKVKSEEEARP